MAGSRRVLYEDVAARIGGMIDTGTYRPGDRIPSIRELRGQMRVSANTVMEAYALLENQGKIEARPQSGFYVRSTMLEPEDRPAKGGEVAEAAPSPVILDEVSLQVMRNVSNVSLVPLGGSIPNADLLPALKLSRMIASESRRFPLQSVSYAPAKGIKRLRAQIARRSLSSGCALTPDEIVITSGCIEAMTLALQAICRPGDTVVIGSPVYYTFLNFIQWLGLKVLEIPSTPKEGMNLDVLAYAIRQTPVAACICIANFNNPTGSLMPEEKKRELVNLLGRHDIPLIEDDVYGELSFGATRPPALKSYDEKGLVLYCSSFSKTLAPGYRVGWIAPGRFYRKIKELKTLFNIATATPTQMAVAEFLANGGYDHHLRSIRRTYARQVILLRDAVGRYFPPGTRVSRPEGGFVLWVELPGGMDALALYESALHEGIGIAPGRIFTLGEKYGSCFRLNAAFWSEGVERALETLGGMAEKLEPTV